MTDSQNTLLMRRVGELEVSLSWLPITEMLILTVEYNGRQMAHTVEPDRAMDAFNHPCCYIGEAQVEALGIR